MIARASSLFVIVSALAVTQLASAQSHALKLGGRDLLVSSPKAEVPGLPGAGLPSPLGSPAQSTMPSVPDAFPQLGYSARCVANAGSCTVKFKSPPVAGTLCICSAGYSFVAGVVQPDR